MRIAYLLPLLALGGCSPDAPPLPPAEPLEANPPPVKSGTSPVAAARMAAPAGTDWPTFLGPTQDNVSTEKGIINPWPKAGLGKVWDCPLGVGYAPPAVAAGKLFHFDRFDDTCRLTCRVAATGKQVWTFEYPTSYKDIYGYDPGPRSGPTVDGDRVYIYGPEGMLHCVNVADGKEIWKLDTKEKYHFQQNFFGVGGTPLIDGDLVIIPVGGSEKGPRPVDLRDVKPDGTALVALDKKTGAVKYAKGNELASYSSPLIRTIDGKKTGLYFARGGLLGFDPQTGETAFHYKWRAKDMESVNAANPLVVGNQVLVTECYGPGSALLDLAGGKPKEVWTDLEREKFEKAMMCHWNTPIHHDGFVYGSSGRHDNEAELRCVELKTGELKWKQKRTYRTSLLKVDNHLVNLSEYGDLSLIRLNSEKYDEVSKYSVEELNYPCWAPPVLSGGLLYLRGRGTLVCLELIPEKK